MKNPLDSIDKGVIFTVKENVYIDFPGGKWNDHFVMKETFWSALEYPKNNGYFTARNSRGVEKWFNVDNVSRVIG